MNNRPLLIPVILFLAGAGLASRMSCMPAWWTALACAAMMVLMVLSVRTRVLFTVALCLFFLSLGSYRHLSTVAPRGDDIAKSIGEAPERECLVYGRVAGMPENKRGMFTVKVSFVMEAGSLLIGGMERQVTGKVRADRYDTSVEISRGDLIVMGGKISIPRKKNNPAGFDYRAYLERKGIRAVLTSGEKDHFMISAKGNGPVYRLRRYIRRMRRKAYRIIRQSIRPEASAVSAAVLLGKRDGMGPGLEETFIRTGTMHMLAVSGFHAGIASFVFLKLLLFLKCPRKAAYLSTMMFLFIFAVFTGWRPSTVRAALMGTFMLAGLMRGTRTDITGSLALAAFTIVYLDPGALSDPGFILSVAAVISIIGIVPFTDSMFFPLEDMKRKKVLRLAAGSLSVTSAVLIGTAPLTAQYFRIVVPGAILVNLVAVPALVLMVVSGYMFLGAAAAASFHLTGWLAMLHGGVISALLNVLSFSERLPCLHMRVPSPTAGMIAAYYLTLMLMLFFFRKNKRYLAGAAALFLLAADLVVWDRAMAAPTAGLRMTFFDAGKADASVMELPGGEIMVVDGGSAGSTGGYAAGREILAPWLWQKDIRKIDCVVISHPHEDHFGGLSYILDNFDVGTVIEGDAGEEHYEMAKRNPYYRRFRDIVAKKEVPVIRVSKGDGIEGLEGVRLFVMNPLKGLSYGNLNDDSLVLRAVTEKGASFLLAGDIEEKAIKDTLAFGEMLRCDVLKAPHHGGNIGDDMTASLFFEKVSPDIIIITTVKGRKLNMALTEYIDGHPRAVKHITGISGYSCISEEDIASVKHIPR